MFVKTESTYALLGIATIIALSLALSVCAQDFGFPEETGFNKDKQNANNRKPLFVPNRCGENEYLYPGDQENDWICDCKPGHIYFPQTAKCYSIYTRGPCRQGEYLILPHNNPVPRCYPNNCGADETVMFQNKCYRLNEPGPCPFPELGNVVAVNVTTLLVQCQKTSIELNNRFGDETELDGELPYCAPGSKRFVNGICPSI